MTSYVFKINGERNSGTTFLTNLICINFNDYFEHKIIDDVCYYWKHGVPDNTVKNYIENKTVVDIFVFRNLNDWLVSMIYNPYHLVPFYDFQLFLENKQYSCETQLTEHCSNKILNYDDNDKTIFEIRYYKFNSIIDYFNNNDNVILVNLEYLQNNENCLHFLNTLNNKFNLNKNSDELITSLEHTKIFTNEKNRKYEINASNYQNIINQYKNDEIENFINNLTFIVK